MKKLLLMFSMLICLASFSTVKAENANKIVDEASILSLEQKEELNTKINDFISNTNYDMVVYITNNHPYLVEYDASDDDAITKVADDYYDQNGYGCGEDKDGLILLVDIGVRNCTITTCGSSCISTYTDYALNDIYEDLYNYFANDEWAKGALAFVDDAAYVFRNYDYYHPQYNYEEHEVNHFTQALVPAFIGAIIITIVSFLILRGQLKNTGIRHSANNYMSKQNINISRSGDVYLYTDVRREKIERPKPSSSTSSTHTSSSGTSHGGGGSHRF